MAEKRSQRPPWLGEDQRGWDHARVHRQVLADEALGAYEIAVYVGLAIHAEAATGSARPSIATLAGYGGMSVRRAHTAISTLAEAGWISVTQQQGHASSYVLLPPPTPAPAAQLPVADPCTTCISPLHETTRTPAPRADELEPVDESHEREENTGALFEVADDPEALTPAQLLVLDFEAFWLAYPRKVAKPVAVKAYAAARKRATAAEILAGVERYKVEKRGAPTKYIAGPGPWLNADRWLDEPGANVEQEKVTKGGGATLPRRNPTPGRIQL